MACQEGTPAILVAPDTLPILGPDIAADARLADGPGLWLPVEMFRFFRLNALSS